MSQSMAQRIKELRKEKGLTLEQVANIVGVGKSTVRKWETGMIANMKRDKIAALAEALGTTPAFLMGWKEKEPIVEDEFSESRKKLIDFASSVPEDKVDLILRVMQSIAEGN